MLVVSMSNDSDISQNVGPDEVFCTSCGEVIKEQAEICPECGVRQQGAESDDESIPDSKIYELQKVARKSPGTAIALGVLISPLGYVYVGKNWLAVLNFITFNYLLLGIIIVPAHSYVIINNAQDTLERHGESW